MDEQWRSVVGFEGIYEVSNLGRVKSLDRHVAVGHEGKGRRLVSGKMLKLQRNTTGYNVLDLYLASQGEFRKPVKVYRLVAEAFIGIAPSSKHVVNHINGIKTDDRPENLEWITQSENMAHAGELGLMRHGEQCHLSKLTDAQVLEIRKLSEFGLSQHKLANMFNVNQATVWAILAGKTWKHLARESRNCEVQS